MTEIQPIKMDVWRAVDQYPYTAADLDMSSVIAEKDERFSTLIEPKKEQSPTRDPK